MKFVRRLVCSVLIVLGSEMLPDVAKAAMVVDWEITIPSSVVLVPDEPYTLTGTFR